MEPAADAIMADFGVQKKAVLNILKGKANPRGRLPVILPSDMDTEERHCEDIVTDISPYVDSEGNIYTLGYGLDY